MGDESNGKVNGIRHIVRLREILHRWHSVTHAPKVDHGSTSGIPPAISKRLKDLSVACDSDEEGCMSPEPPADVPRGYIPVYVGPEQRRFIIPVGYLSHPVFKLLLEKAEEEFGFDHQGALTIPCEIETFKYILLCMERHQKGLIDDEGNPTGVEE
ncbi:uncharacterized protein M6B38_375770 [Iris pallida]|uniref:Small auxin up regulated protein n=1 Tax=Iris pallida TaxID=29817 RepID=A0AAX6GA65_IRIPA|nr:Uncharacterized protein M6B38_222855 [Iris pallida]KAJ6825363.1 uncharacterized protein M6B38_375770 [Iris pallida]